MALDSITNVIDQDILLDDLTTDDDITIDHAQICLIQARLCLAKTENLLLELEHKKAMHNKGFLSRLKYLFRGDS
ncbi:hypothetical protein [Photobacterium kishitanii]|uniref:Uncharacterized protein n=1 Tax=Photobacterium kishitanii TaxID=318456 RepID=A0A2T3KMG7_9GAMM|nr:hypothetical protein [Photobacterium kishitanii]PSV00978.1 hypothetical protein C9J27_02835 [Photobacterium kishitanii]